MTAAPDLDAAAAAMRHDEACPEARTVTFLGWKGDQMMRCYGCGRTAPVHRLIRQLDTVEEPRRRYRLDCVRCERAIPVTNAKPRVPLCSRCVTRRTRPKPQPEEVPAHAFI